MYIINPEKISGKTKYHKLVAKYLMDNGVPVLSIDNDDYWFADTALKCEVLENAPLWIKGILCLTKGCK